MNVAVVVLLQLTWGKGRGANPTRISVIFLFHGVILSQKAKYTELNNPFS